MIANLTNHDNLSSWLIARRAVIGASESPAILGVGYSSQSPFSVYVDKTAPRVDSVEEESEAYDWGHAIQPVVLSMFTRRTGIPVENPGDFTIARHPEIPWLGCTLDGFSYDPEESVVEVKNVGHYNASDWTDDEPPLRVQVQIQHQLCVTGAKLGYAVACLGGNKLAWHKVERNDRFIDSMLPRLEKFWECVKTRTPPEVDGSTATKLALARLHPHDDGSVVEIADPEVVVWANCLEKAKECIKIQEAVKLEAENRLRAALGEATYGVLDDGRWFSFKTQTRAEHVVAESTFRVLRALKGKPKEIK